MAGPALDLALDGEVVPRLAAERRRPPPVRLVDAKGPVDEVRAAGERVLVDPLDACDRGPQRDAAGLVAVELGPEDDHGQLVAGLSAQDPQVADAHRAGLLDPHRCPDAARVVVGRRRGERPEQGMAPRGDLDGKGVLVAVGQQLGDVEGVAPEPAVGVAEVAAVEPDVALTGDAVEDEPGPRVRKGPRGKEPVAMEDRAGRAGEGVGGAPVARYRHRRPRRVVHVRGDRVAPDGFVYLGGDPGATEIHGETLWHPRRRGDRPPIWT
jgi:hypothetical protein